MDGFNALLGLVGDYLRNLGAGLTMPLVILVLGLILGQGLRQAARSALLIGVGFVGVNLVIALVGAQLGPAVAGIARMSGVNLTTLDVGWPAASAIALGSPIGALIIPLGLVVNVLLLTLGLTRTLNIDLWNLWHSALVGALVQSVTGHFWLGVTAAAAHLTVVLAVADLSAPWIQKQFGLPGVSLPHGTSAPYIAFAVPLNWVFDRIPGLDRTVDPTVVQKRFGIFGEAPALGFVLGVLLGVAGFGFDDPRADTLSILTLAVSLTAVLVLLPRMVALLMEGLLPISEAARRLVERRFARRTFYLGLDSAIAVGQPAVLATSLVLVPVTVLLALLLSPAGNTLLPLVDLATIPFIVAMMVPIFRGNVARSVIGGAVVIGFGLFIASATAASFTAVARAAGFSLPSGGGRISSLVDGANPLTGLFYWLSTLGGWTIALLATAALGFAYWVSRVEKKRDAARLAARRADLADG